MKPNFALDLSHDGISLLHRGTAGWTLVGEAALDDPDLGRRLTDLHRMAAQIESGGITTKLVIPGSQVLYTTVEAKGPDDIAREVQIRSALDGLTPYPVGDLVFDWRADGDKARVAVLARETMDEAEAFALEYKFNPVSFVARPAKGEFSGEPFFGKTKAASQIIGAGERVVPDASPVPHRPRALELPQEAQTTPVAPAAPVTPSTEPSLPARADTQTVADLTPDPFAAFEEAAAPAPASLEPAPAPEATTETMFWDEPDADDTPDEAPEELAPALAPFPPTPGDDGELPPPPKKPRKSRRGKKARRNKTTPAAKPSEPATPEAAPVTPEPTLPPVVEDVAAPVPPPLSLGASDRVAPNISTAASDTIEAPKPDESPVTEPADVPPAADIAVEPASDPAPSFSTRRKADATSGVGALAARVADLPPRIAVPDGSDAGKAPPPLAFDKTPPTTSEARSGPTPPRIPPAQIEKIRAEMAAAMSKPLPGQGRVSAAETEQSDGTRPALGGVARDTFGRFARKAAGGLQSGSARVQDRFTSRRSAVPETKVAGMAAALADDMPTPAGSPEPESASERSALLSRFRRSTSEDTRKEQMAAALAGDLPQEDPSADATDATTLTPPPASEPNGWLARFGGKKTSDGIAADMADALKKDLPHDTDDDVAPKVDVEDKPKRKGMFGRGRADDEERASEAEALTVFGARRMEESRPSRPYLGLVLTLILLLLMAIVAVWSSFFMGDGEVTLFNPAPEVSPLSDPAPAAPVTTDPTTPAPDPTPAETSPPETDVPPAPTTAEVLSPDAAEARYAATGVWQRAPESLPEPGASRLESLDIAPIGTTPGERGDATTLLDGTGTGTEAVPGDPMAPPPPGTTFDLDENGLVRATPEGAVSPAGTLVYSGKPPIVPPVRPGTVAPTVPVPDTAPATVPEAPVAPETPAVPEVLEAPAAPEATVTPPFALPGAPTTPAPARPAGLVPDNAALTPDVEAPTETAAVSPTPVPRPADLPETAALASAAIEAAVEDVIDAAFAGASNLAVNTSPTPTHRPSNFARIVDSAMAAASDGSTVTAAPAVAAAATTSPAIPTSANVASRATLENALNLRQVNLIGIYGTSNARRALVRMKNGRYVKVEVGDRLDGGTVTSISSSRLIYQKGSRAYALDVLPLG